MILATDTVLVVLSELLTAQDNNNAADRCVRQELRSSVMRYNLCERIRAVVLVSQWIVEER